MPMAQWLAQLLRLSSTRHYYRSLPGTSAAKRRQEAAGAVLAGYGSDSASILGVDLSWENWEIDIPDLPLYKVTQRA